ncbi:uncharacterized protein TNCV_2613951 [Trichonephila clavipes]|nr:uncharacterized protein TNCV_2613951 [Trichonephila clavipes]
MIILSKRHCSSQSHWDSEAWMTKAEMDRLSGIRPLDYKGENLENENPDFQCFPIEEEENPYSHGPSTYSEIPYECNDFLSTFICASIDICKVRVDNHEVRFRIVRAHVPSPWDYIALIGIHLYNAALKSDASCLEMNVRGLQWYRIVADLVTSSSPVPLKTRRVGQRCMLSLSRVETSSRWRGVVVRIGGASSGVVHVTGPWFTMTRSVTKSPRVAEQWRR